MNVRISSRTTSSVLISSIRFKICSFANTLKSASFCRNSFTLERFLGFSCLEETSI